MVFRPIDSPMITREERKVEHGKEKDEKKKRKMQILMR
jgi:hypothetical protein